MGVDTIGNRDTAGQRQNKRNRVLLAAKLKSAFGEIDCRLRDLSRQGALIEGKPMPPVGTDVVFSRGSIQVPARVAWAGKDRAGIEFTFPIDEHEVLVQLKKTTGGPTAPVPMAPSRYKSMTGKELEAARLWGVQVGLTLRDDS